MIRSRGRLFMHRILLFLSCLLAVLAVTFAARADEEPPATPPPVPAAAPAPPPEPSGPQTMRVGIKLEKLSKFEVGPGPFAAEFYLTFKCSEEPCKPAFEITNGKVVGKPDMVVDEKFTKEFRIKADLEGLVDLSEFPFDKHLLYIGLVDENENVTYEVDEHASTIEESVKLAGWT